MNDLVSAVIPTYNYARFVARAIDSVLAQDYSPLECIVVDDGSTDDTPEVLARYGDRIRVVRQENRGLSAARNAGLRAARGDRVALLDADDVWKPAKLARQVALLDAEPEVGAVGCAWDVLEGGISPLRPMSSGAAADLREQLRRVAVRELWVEGSGSGALVPRRVFEAVGGFDEGLRAAEDWDMWLRIAARHRIANVPEVLVSISKHRGGTFRNAGKMEENQRKVYEAAIARWPDLLDARTRRRMRALILADACGEYFGAARYPEALGRALASLREWPLDGARWALAARLGVRCLRGSSRTG